jgi:hypothetical protein
MYVFAANMSLNNGMSYRYTEVKSRTVYKGKLIQQITFDMRAPSRQNRAQARVKVLGFGQF